MPKMEAKHHRIVLAFLPNFEALGPGELRLIFQCLGEKVPQESSHPVHHRVVFALGNGWWTSRLWSRGFDSCDRHGVAFHPALKD